ncbi:MAG TPA: vWA domain-containing protein [Candidatus Margulisiibacteriota bacterium]|nr:vWA domain-containing protein [Candidatus Margulisiibacteriota bacterium]
MPSPDASKESPLPPRFDPWSGNRYGGVRWFALSTLFHAGLLLLLATVTLTVIRKAQEIRVKVVDDAAVSQDDFEGAPSLRDLAGVLKMEKTLPQRAAPSGPVIQGVRAPDMPRIGGVGPKLGTGPALDTVSTNLSFGSGAIGGLGGGFGDYVGGLRKVGLDIALVIDTTDSMQFVIDDVKAKLSQLVGAIQRMVPTSRIGIVIYRDKGDDYVVKWTDLSFHTEKLQDFLSHVTADGGGDWEEAVKEALDAAVNELKWRKQAKRIIILVGGSPPHPWDVDAVHDIVRNFRKEGGYISTIDVTKKQHDEFDRQLWKSLHGKEPYKPSPMPEFYNQVSQSFGEIAKEGGGELISLDADRALIRSVLELTFGSRWKVEMAKYLKELS